MRVGGRPWGPIRAIAAALLVLSAAVPASLADPAVPSGFESTPAGADQTYLVGPGDKLNITVFRVKDLTVEKMQVDATGQILLPLIGSVMAQGKTTTELSAEIAARLGEKYLQSPQVSVVVEEAASQKVTVEGAVNEAGVFTLRGRTSLMEAVAMAKGLSKTANPRRVAIIRTVDGQQKAAVFDLAKIRMGKAGNPEILANDIVVVDDSGTKVFWQGVVNSLPAFMIFSYF